jgi:hypothetical protein
VYKKIESLPIFRKWIALIHRSELYVMQMKRREIGIMGARTETVAFSKRSGGRQL